MRGFSLSYRRNLVIKYEAFIYQRRRPGVEKGTERNKFHALFYHIRCDSFHGGYGRIKIRFVCI